LPAPIAAIELGLVSVGEAIRLPVVTMVSFVCVLTGGGDTIGGGGGGDGGGGGGGGGGDPGDRGEAISRPRALLNWLISSICMKGAQMDSGSAAERDNADACTAKAAGAGPAAGAAPVRISEVTAKQEIIRIGHTPTQMDRVTISHDSLLASRSFRARRSRSARGGRGVAKGPASDI
jgi:hypothetical protein